MKKIIAIIPLVLALAGCTTNKHYVTAATSTIIGLEVAQNPSSQMYQAKLGYNRSELAMVPSNRSSTGKANDPSTGNGAADTTDVVMELHYANIFSLSTSGIYQRLAVGKNAVSQPGAALMFAKGKDGNLDPAVASAVLQSVNTIPAPDAATTQIKLPLAKAFDAATDKTKFEKAAAVNGYASFSAFLIEVNTPPEKISAVARAIQEQK